MELTENVFGRSENIAVVNRRHGRPPQQSSIPTFEGLSDNSSPSGETEGGLDEAFYGDDGFEEEELDLEGYEIDE